MEEHEIIAGRTYYGPKGSTPRLVTRTAYWWNRNYHRLIYYVGRSGREIECDVKVFAKWAVRE